ncbi:hypothetical protein Tco_0896640 [Tanacetum coccineum]
MIKNMARSCFADNDMHDSNEISENTYEDGDVVCVDGSYKSISTTHKLVVFDASQSSVINNYKPGVFKQTNVEEHGDEDYLLPMMHVMRGDIIGLPLESTRGGGYTGNFLKGNREIFNVTCGLEITEKPVVKCKDDALWFRRLTGRSDVVVYATDYKFYCPRRKGKHYRMSNGSDYFQSIKNYPISASQLTKNVSETSHLQDRPVSVNEGQMDAAQTRVSRFCDRCGYPHNSKLYTDCSLEMNVDEAMVTFQKNYKLYFISSALRFGNLVNAEVVDDYSDKKIVVKLEDLSVHSDSNINMVNKQEDLIVSECVETTEGKIFLSTPAGKAYDWNRTVSRKISHLHSISKLAREVKEFDLDLAERVMEVVREHMRRIACSLYSTQGYYIK